MLRVIKPATNQVVNRFEHGWSNAQYRYSSRFAAIIAKRVARFCCPFFGTFRNPENFCLWNPEKIGIRNPGFCNP